MRRLVQFDLVCLISLIIVFIVGCSSCSSAQKGQTKTVKTIAFISNSSATFWSMVRRGCERADVELPNVDVAFKMPFEGTAIEQNRLIQEALNRDHADAIAISPIDPVNQKESINGAAKRSVVITQDSDAPDSDRLFYIGADNLDAGRQAAALMKQALPEGGRIAVFVGKRAVQNVQDRYQGLVQSLERSKIEVIGLFTDDNDRVQAKDNVAETIKQYPDIAGMVGLWSYNGPAILAAVKEAKKTGKIKIVCFDDENETLDGIKQGAIFGTVAQQPFIYGYQGIQLLARVLNGDRSMIPENRKIFIPPLIVQRANVDEYRNKMAQIVLGR